MKPDPYEFERYRMAVMDNPAPKGLSVTGILSYLHHIAVLAGGLEGDTAPKTMPRANRALPPEQREVRLPYKDNPEDDDPYRDVEVSF